MHAVTKPEVEHLQNLIAGKWVDAKGGQRIEVVNPYNNEVVGSVPHMSLEEVKHAIDRLADYEATLTSHQRGEILYNAAQEMKARREELAAGISAESGMSLKNSRVEVDRGVGLMLTASEEAKRIYGEQLPSDTDSAGRDKIILAMRFPVGVVSAIVPFNRPMNQVVVKVAPAIAAGNRVIVKPTERTPMSGIRYIKILLDNGLPPEMISVVTGKSNEIGDELVASRKIDMVTFTGSTEIGRRLTNIGGIKKLTMELGGNDPLIVCEDADLDVAVKLAMAGAFGNAGQACRGVKRILVMENVADEFAKKFASAASKLKFGDPFDPDTDIGTLIDEPAAKDVERVVNGAVEDGAKVLCGHKRVGALYPATVLDHVSPESAMVIDETFGPTAPIIRIKDIKEACRIANSTEYGLQSGVVTKNLDNIRYAIKHLKAGAVNINEGPQFDMPNIPFGGVKQSGIGREGIRYAIQEMTYIKTVVM
ncbi:MAG: aldehyde dehydrogenase family protein [Acidiferrobacterales bacterium]